MTADLMLMVGLLLLTGAVAGLLAGLLGVGGGIILVPAYLALFTHMGYASEGLMRVCLATSLATIIVTSARSVMAHHAKGAVEWPILRAWLPFVSLGALVGVLVVASLKSDALQLIFGVLIALIALYMAFGRAEWRLGSVMPTGIWRAGIAASIGGLAVLTGIGGGSMAVPLMTLHSVPIHRAVATSAGFGMAIALPSALGFLATQTAGAPPYTLGAVNLPAFLITILMTLVTAPYGARLAHWLDPKRLKKVFAGFMLLMALNMLRGVLS